MTRLPSAGDAKRKKNWKGDEPAFLREYLGKWVKAGARSRHRPAPRVMTPKAQGRFRLRSQAQER